jgi:hypothetical protein
VHVNRLHDTKDMFYLLGLQTENKKFDHTSVKLENVLLQVQLYISALIYTRWRRRGWICHTVQIPLPLCNDIFALSYWCHLRGGVTLCYSNLTSMHFICISQLTSTPCPQTVRHSYLSFNVIVVELAYRENKRFSTELAILHIDFE